MSQISNSEIEDIMIEIQRMNLNEIKEVNPKGHVRGPSKINEEHPNTFEKKYGMPKYKPRETNFEQLGNTGVRPEKFQYLEKGQNRNFGYEIVISVKNSKFIL